MDSCPPGYLCTTQQANEIIVQRQLNSEAPKRAAVQVAFFFRVLMLRLPIWVSNYEEVSGLHPAALAGKPCLMYVLSAFSAEPIGPSAILRSQIRSYRSTSK